jgi:predicted phage terminase large subunit-like protein
MASSYQPVPASERKIKLPRLYLEKKDPTLWRGLEAPEGWVELWKEHQEEVRLKKEGKLTQLKEIREERRKKKISLAIQKNWERKKKKQEAENKKLLTSKELSKEEIEAVKSLAREHLIDFGVYMGTEKGELYQPAWFHEEMADELMKVANGTSEYDILMFWLPPGSGKSRLATQLFPAYMLGKDPTTQIIVTSYSGDLAEKFGSNTRDIMESKKYQSLFETFLRKDSRSKDNWETTKGGSYNAVGLGGSITGKRANIFIIDDLIRGRAEANSKSYRDNAWDFFMSTAFTRGANRLSQKKPIYIFCNTRWHTDDVPGRLLEMQKEGGEHLPKMKVISYPAIAEVDEKHRKAGEALWEKGYPLSELNKVKATITGYEWSALYQQNPITAENQEFKVETFQEIALDDVLKDSNRVFMSIDTAISRKSSGDFTGITLNFVNKENKWRIMTWQRRFSPKELIEFIFQKWEQYKIEKIGIEKTIYKDAIQEFFNDEMRRRGKFPYIVELQHNQTNKETRVRGLLPYYESKTVYHIKGHCEGLENELLNFPMGKHDDVIDSLAYQIQLAEQLVVRGPTLKRKPFMKYI